MYTLLLVLTSLLFVNEGDPVELGKVNWLRNYNKAIQQSEVQQKPVFLLFQEVPGCSTCRNYGSNVLSHPLIVEAIEDEFIPLAIFNNKKGHDLDILKQFKEPSWNNPVARIVDEKGRDVVKRVSGNYSQLGIVEAMIEALVKSGREVPVYLKLLQEQLIGEEHAEEIALSMYCFWTGERELASMPGVISTEAGFMDGKEVVKVKYNSKFTSSEQVATSAAKVNCADGVYVPSTTSSFQFKDVAAKPYSKYRKDKQTKYYLYNSDYKYVPMLPIQELKVNYALATRSDVDGLLSPRQLHLLDQLKKQKPARLQNRIASDFVKSWYDM